MIKRGNEYGWILLRPYTQHLSVFYHKIEPFHQIDKSQWPIQQSNPYFDQEQTATATMIVGTSFASQFSPPLNRS